MLDLPFCWRNPQQLYSALFGILAILQPTWYVHVKQIFKYLCVVLVTSVVGFAQIKSCHYYCMWFFLSMLEWKKSKSFIRQCWMDVFFRPPHRFGRQKDPSCPIFLKSRGFDDIKYDYDIKKSKSQNVRKSESQKVGKSESWKVGKSEGQWC